MNKRINSSFFYQENPLKTIWKTSRKTDFLGNQTPQNRKGEDNQKGWLLLCLSIHQEANFGGFK